MAKRIDRAVLLALGPQPLPSPQQSGQNLGPHKMPDARLLSNRGRIQHAYTVSFDGDALWSFDGHRNDPFKVDLLEDYLTLSDSTR